MRDRYSRHRQHRDLGNVFPSYRAERASTSYDGYDWDTFFPHSKRDWRTAIREKEAARANRPDEVLGEVGLVLVAILGIVLAINSLLVVFHIH